MTMDIKRSGLIRTLYLETELAGLTNGLDVGDEEKRVIKDDIYFFGLNK